MESAKHETVKPQKVLQIPGWFNQLKIFIRRDVLSKLANQQYVLINFLEAPLLAFILSFLVRFYNTDEFLRHGYIFGENENIPAYLFMAVVVALFIGLTVSAEEIIKDRKIRKREKFLNLSNSSYLMSKIVILFVLSAVQTMMFVLIGNSILGIKGMWFDYWLVLFSVSCFANLLGLNVSSAFNSAITIYILIPFLIIPQLLLSGVLVKFDKLNPSVTEQGVVPFWGEVMVSRWGFEALAVNQFVNNKYERLFYSFEKKYEQAIAYYEQAIALNCALAMNNRAFMYHTAAGEHDQTPKITKPVSFMTGPLSSTTDRKSTRLNSSHIPLSRMPSSA